MEVYAVGNEAAIVICALGPGRMPSKEEAALSHCWERGGG